MPITKADIIAQLRRDILPLQGLKSTLHSASFNIGFGPVKYAFPNASFPLGAIHEFCYNHIENATASCGFIIGILSMLMRNNGVSLWISSSRIIFPPALTRFGIDPDKIIFLDLQKEKDVLWAMEEALKCEGLAAVVGETKDLNFTNSRRLQLAVEESKVTGFILHPIKGSLSTTTCVSRWKISHLPSVSADGLPGVSFPHWDVELLKVRNGKPGSWKIEWFNGRFRQISKRSSISFEQQRKTG